MMLTKFSAGVFPKQDEPQSFPGGVRVSLTAGQKKYHRRKPKHAISVDVGG